jgi:hypothetical protein
MIRPISHPNGTRFDCADQQPPAIIKWLASLHELRDPRKHHLVCETAAPGHQAVYVWRPAPNQYQVRHFPGSGHHGDHNVVPESDEHKRGKEYYFREFDRRGIPALTKPEPVTDNKCRPDVLAPAARRVTAVEFQAYNTLQDRDYRARTTKLLHATSLIGTHARPLPSGILPVWIHAFGMPAGWSYPAPSIAAQDTRWEALPRPGSVTAIGVRSIEAETCQIGSRWTSRGCPAGCPNFCGSVHPFDAPRPGLDTGDVMAMTAAAELVPIVHFTGAIYLVSSQHAALYDELGGHGTYRPASKARRLSAPMSGHLRSPHHQPSHPREPSGQIPSDTINGFRIPRRSEQLAANRWRCTRCGAAMDRDPCPQCGGNRIIWDWTKKAKSPPGSCPFCPAEHPRCKFTAGSLYCVVDDCQNPHHRMPAVPRG